MAIDKIPKDMECECRTSVLSGPVFNSVRQYEDPNDLTFGVMQMKYSDAFDVLKKGIKVSNFIHFTHAHKLLLFKLSRLMWCLSGMTLVAGS